MSRILNLGWFHPLSVFLMVRNGTATKDALLRCHLETLEIFTFDALAVPLRLHLPMTDLSNILQISSLNPISDGALAQVT